ncbi:MAG: hypothetical protein FJX76_02950 [Armatimonadetes bacterium]|nr:hypothetical protein [Armatimonadota bacterium]
MVPIRVNLVSPHTPISTPSSPKPGSEAAQAEQRDDVRLLGPKEEKELPPCPISWRTRVWTAAKWVFAGTFMSTTLLGSIGYLANHDALHTPISTSKPLADLPAPAHTPGPVTAMPDVSLAAKSAPASMVVIVPGGTMQQVTRQLQSSEAIQQKISETQELIEAKLRTLPPIDSQVLIDIHAPLPTSDRSLLHVGSVDLPSAGLGALQTEKIPVAVDAHVQPRGVPVRVEICRDQAAEPPANGPAGAVYLGSFRTCVYAETASVHIDGEVSLNSDFDGRGAEQAREKWLQHANDRDAGRAAVAKRNLQELEQRKTQGARLNRLGSERGFGWLLHSVLDHQGVKFSREVPLQKDKPLVEGTHHLWLGPDKNHDGRADIVVTEQLTTPGVDALKIEGREMQPNSEVHFESGLTSWCVETLHGQVEDQLQAEVEKRIGAFSRELPERVRGLVQSAWSDAAKQVEKIADAQLQEFYKNKTSSQLQLNDQRVPRPIGVALGNLLPTGDGSLGAAVELSTPTAKNVGDASIYLRHPNLIPESVRKGPGAVVAVSGDTLNAAMRDTSEGGNVDWRGMLGDIAAKKGLKSLQFNKDAQGRMLTPRLAWHDGKPHVDFEVTAEVGGFKPVGTATGLVTGATGLIDGGAAEVQKGLKEVAGVPGEVVGTVVRAPFWLIDKIVGGARDVVDNTVGVVVDALPEAGTRPVVNVKMSVPIDLKVNDGVLTVAPSANGLKVTGGHGKSDALVLPTNVIQSLIAQSVAESDGGRQDVGGGLNALQIPVDLQAKGLRFEAAAAAQSNTVPDFFVRVTPTADFDVHSLAR